MLKACANFAESKCDFLSNHYLISGIKSDVSTGDTTIDFMVGGYAWKMNGNECGVTYFTLHTPRNLRHQVLDLKMKNPHRCLIFDECASCFLFAHLWFDRTLVTAVTIGCDCKDC